MPALQTLNRTQAFGFHFLGSLVVASLALCLVFLVWYSQPLATATGVTAIILIVIGVDMVLGPLLTLIVFNPKKKSLKVDLSIILCVQIVALIYGIWTVGVARPAWIVFNGRDFELVQAHEVEKNEPEIIAEQYRQAPFFGPEFVALKVPESVDGQIQMALSQVGIGDDINRQPVFYSPLETLQSELSKAARPVSELSQFNEAATLEHKLKQYPDAQCWLPLNAKIQPMVVLVDCTDGSIIDVVNLRPKA